MKNLVWFCPLAVLWAAVSCAPKKGQAETVVPVTVLQVQDLQSSYTRTYIGTVVSKHSTVLLSPYAGTVVELPVRTGQKVKQDALIVKVDSPTANNMKKTADATLSQARDGYRRAEKVYKAGGMSELQWKDISTKLIQAESTAEMAQSMQDDCQLRAPWDATVCELHVATGDEVKPLARLATLIDEHHLDVSIGVPENEFSRISEGMKGKVVVPALDYLEAEVEIDEIGVQASMVSHSYQVRLSFEKQPEALKAGMACKVSLETDRQDRMIVPASVIKVDDNGRYVWLVNADDRVEKRYVRAGGFAGTGIAIESGVRQGDRIIVEGTQKVSSGMKVSPEVLELL